jgi:hypothetical protein
MPFQLRVALDQMHVSPELAPILTTGLYVGLGVIALVLVVYSVNRLGKPEIERGASIVVMVTVALVLGMCIAAPERLMGILHEVDRRFATPDGERPYLAVFIAIVLFFYAGPIAKLMRRQLPSPHRDRMWLYLILTTALAAVFSRALHGGAGNFDAAGAAFLGMAVLATIPVLALAMLTHHYLGPILGAFSLGYLVNRLSGGGGGDLLSIYGAAAANLFDFVGLSNVTLQIAALIVSTAWGLHEIVLSPRRLFDVWDRS